MAWNAIRRAVTAEIRLEANAWIEKRLNDVLPDLQVQFQKTLNQGRMPALKADYKNWVKDAMTAAIRPELTE